MLLEDICNATCLKRNGNKSSLDPALLKICYHLQSLICVRVQLQRVFMKQIICIHFSLDSEIQGLDAVC